MLTINQLTKTYSNGVRALDGINLTIPKGMFGLLGPNGAGKSSLMRTISTLQTPRVSTSPEHPKMLSSMRSRTISLYRRRRQKRAEFSEVTIRVVLVAIMG